MIHRITGAAFRMCHLHPGALGSAAVLAFLAVTTTGEAMGAARFVSVTAVSAPVMDGPAADAQELGRAARGTRLTASGRTSGDWLEIQAPAFISGWVYGELIRDSVIAASSVKVRSGPGIGYVAMGVLTRGDAVVVRGRRGDWVEVEGQPSLSAWIERAMVAEGAAVDMTAASKPPVAPAPVAQPAPPPVVVPDPPAPKPVIPPPPPVAAPPVVVAAPAPPEPPEPVESKPVQPVAPPLAAIPVQKPLAQPPAVVMPVPAPSARPVRQATLARPRASVTGTLSPVGVRLLKSAPQGEPVIVSGELRPVGVALFAPAPYRLVAADDAGPARTLCYVTSQEALPPPGTKVRLQGLKYWVYGSRQPVVLVREITPFPGLTVTH